MKHFNISFFLVLIISLSGCMKSTNMSVMRPAELTVPQHINKVAIVDRTKPESKVANVLEGIITGEGVSQDKQGIQNALIGMQRILDNSPRFEVKRTDLYLKGSGSGGTFPTPLRWSEVQRYTRQYDVDALIVLETYDTDFIVTEGKKEVVEKNEAGEEVTVTKFTASGVATVKMGFRLYDPVKKSIYDQHHFNNTKTWSTTADSPKAAVEALIGKTDATNKVSYLAGNNYGRRIAPIYVRVSRSFYKKDKKHGAVASGARKAEVGDWDGAIDSWKYALQDSYDFDTKGKACYNLALGYEVLGDFQEAKYYAQKSYSDYGNKKAKDYVGVINRRIWDEERVREQLGQR